MLPILAVADASDLDSWSLFLAASLKAAAILAIAALASRLARRQSAALRHQVWTVAVLATLLLPLAVILLPEVPLAVLPADTSASQVTHEGFPDPAHARAGAHEREVSESVSPTATLPVATTHATPPLTPVSETSPAAATAGVEFASASEGAAADQPLRYAQSVVIGVWLIGCLAASIPFCGWMVRQAWRRRSLRPITDRAWLDAVAAASHQLGLHREVPLYTAFDEVVPAVFGILRPYLVVPSNWRTWSDEQRRCVLLHELAHVQRWDLVTQFLGRMSAAVYWFNPLAWYAVRQMRIERELACDNCVLAAGQRPSEYARQLVQTLRMCRSAPCAAGLAMGNSARLDQRVLAVLDETCCRLPLGLTAARLSLLGALLLTATFGTVSLSTRRVTAAPPSADAANGDAQAQGTEPKSDEQLQPRTFTGRVLHQGKPVDGATITLWQRIGHHGFYEHWHPRESLDAEPQRVAISDENGAFTFTFSDQALSDTPWNIWPDGWQQVQVVVSKPGLGVGWCNLGQLHTGGDISLSGTVPLRGRVVDGRGRPRPGCRIEFDHLAGDRPAYSELWQPTWSGLSPQVMTNENGEFEMLGLPENTRGIRLVVSGQEIATKTFAVNLGSERGSPVRVVVEPTQAIEGTVRDRMTGRPIAGVVVYGDEDQFHRRVRAVTNDRGEYRLVGLPPARKHKLTTYAPFSSGYLVRYSSVTAGAGLEPVTHDIDLRRGVPVQLTVVDKRTRQPLNAEVHYSPTGDNPLYQESTRAAYKPSDGFRRFYTPDERGVVRFVAYPGRGLVYAKLQGQSYLPVGDTPEILENQAADPHFGFASMSGAYAVIHPRADQDRVELELEADGGESVSGQLIDMDGQPVLGATIMNRSYNRFHADHSLTAALGGSDEPEGYHWGFGEPLADASFQVELLEPARPRLVVFLHPQHKLIGVATATAGQPLGDVQLRKWGQVEGVVTDAAGRPLANVEVSVDYRDRTAEGNWPARPVARTDALGRFVVERLIPDRQHQLSIHAPDGFASPEKRELKPATGELLDVGTIRLEASGGK